MVFSFAMDRTGACLSLAAAQSLLIHAVAHRSPSICNATLQFSAGGAPCWNPLKRQASAIVEPLQRIKSRADSPLSLSWRFQMVITAAHISPIIALIAGILILIMPRLLNLVVAIYLICIGLIGLGVLKMFHM
jgi:hypothetical protein